MLTSCLQYFIKKKYHSISHQGFATIKELDDADDITRTPDKDINPYHNWQDIPFNYLNEHYTGITTLSPAGFLFYTPAIMYQVLQDIDERNNCSSVLWWVYNLSDDILGNKSFKCISLFDKEQLFILIIFLEKIMSFGIVDEQKMLSIISAIENVIVSNNLDDKNKENP